MVQGTDLQGTMQKYNRTADTDTTRSCNKVVVSHTHKKKVVQVLAAMLSDITLGPG